MRMFYDKELSYYSLSYVNLWCADKHIKQQHITKSVNVNSTVSLWTYVPWDVHGILCEPEQRIRLFHTIGAKPTRAGKSAPVLLELLMQTYAFAPVLFVEFLGLYCGRVCASQCIAPLTLVSVVSITFSAHTDGSVDVLSVIDDWEINTFTCTGNWNFLS